MTMDEIQREDDQLILNDVARAVEEREFVPYVQPCFELDSRRAMAAETLVRWTLPDDGTVVPAGAFVPSLERTRTICGLDWFIAGEMCAFLSDSKGTPAYLPIALNVSNQHAEDPEFAHKLAATADWRGVDHKLVCIELSQTLMAEDKRVKDILVPTMIAEGFGVIADNFCAGAEKLRPLVDMGIVTVKVAASLWRDGADEAVAALVEEARSLGVALVAENVETEEELQALVSKGFNYAQGYYLARPMSLQDYVVLCSQ